MQELHPVFPAVDGHHQVTATQLPDAFSHPMASSGRHWVLRRMRKEKVKPVGYAIHSPTGTLIGVVVRCRAMARPSGAVSFHDWVVLPARGAVPRRPVAGLNAAIQAVSRTYADAPRTEGRKRAYRERRAIEDGPDAAVNEPVGSSVTR